MSVDLKDKAISVEVFKYFFDYLMGKKVSKERRINNHTLEDDVSLTADDVNAIADINGSVELRHIKNQGTNNKGKLLLVGEDGSIVLDDVNIDSLSVLSTRGGTMTGQLSTIDPIEDANAANKRYVDSHVREEIQKVNTTLERVTDNVSIVGEKVSGMFTSVSVTLLSTNWENNYQTIPVDGVTGDISEVDILASPAADDTNFSAYTENNIRLYEQMSNAVKFKCESVPPTNVTVNLMIRKKVSLSK